MKKEGEEKIKQINSSANPVNGKIIAIILTITILIIGTFFYFAASGRSNGLVVSNSEDMNSDVSQKQMNTNDNLNNTEDNYKYAILGVQADNIYVKTNPEGMQKLFYYHPVNEPINIPLLEGNMEEYLIHSIGGQKYYPIIIGYEEAKIMRQERRFNNIGDPIKNFFGKNVVIVGVMQRTDGIMDMAYIMPLTEEELN